MKPLIKLIILLIVVTIVGCSNTQNSVEPISITFWTTTSDKESEFLIKQVLKFEDEHPGIDINMMEEPFDSASNKFKTAILGDSAPDVFRSDNSWVPELADLGLLYPLDDLISKEDQEDYIESSFRSVQYQGETFGLPMVTEAPALLYNKRLLLENGFSSPPQTMDELLAMSKTLTTDGQYGIYLSDDSFFSLPYLWAFGGGTITDDRQIQITTVESQNALKFMLRLKREKVIQPYPDFTDGYNRMMEDFTTGKVAMILNGPWAVSTILSSEEFSTEENLGIAPIPAGPKGQGSPVGGHSYVISRYSEHPEETYEFMEYMNSVESQVLQSKEIKTLPTRKSSYNDKSLNDDYIISGFRQQIDVSKARPLIPEGAQMFNDFTPNLSDILLEKMTVEEGTKKIESSWKIILE
jgi:arabinogalactan oligomer/maltooligosaccharide transport system substrate-binding protein